jgi:hypothetical protein
MTGVIDRTDSANRDRSASGPQLATTRELIDRMAEWTGADFHRLADSCRERSSVGDEIDWWLAAARVRRMLRIQHLSRAAGSASSTAARAVQLAAETVGLSPDEPDVIVAARAAGEALCALTAGVDARAEVGYFLDRLGLARASDRARSRHVA